MPTTSPALRPLPDFYLPGQAGLETCFSELMLGILLPSLQKSKNMKKIVMTSVLLFLASFGAFAASPAPSESPDPKIKNSEMLVDFQLFEEGNGTSKMLTSSLVKAKKGEKTPINVSREQDFVSSFKELPDGTGVLIPATFKEGISVIVNLENPAHPAVFITLATKQKTTPANKPGQPGVAQGNVFSAVWALGAGNNEYKFKANGKKYRVVISTLH